MERLRSCLQNRIRIYGLARGGFLQWCRYWIGMGWDAGRYSTDCSDPPAGGEQNEDGDRE